LAFPHAVYKIHNYIGGFDMQASQVKYRTEETSIPFQGKTITIRNHTPILSPKERERRKKEIERRLYNVVMKYKTGQE